MEYRVYSYHKGCDLLNLSKGDIKLAANSTSHISEYLDTCQMKPSIDNPILNEILKEISKPFSDPNSIPSTVPEGALSKVQTSLLPNDPLPIFPPLSVLLRPVLFL
jgi:hypothetical protein